ncbi:hypothetical protein NLJ89_g9026 [Agrocybe chaxingu]|uniref:Uncharacterized protein n=1 Tax=Agrocybe chaxingu TaxID=84603 RepID=A0A9W8MQ92_9AGAR|nr:hypothetical protein NLJ89_g9026 [Agrocybe chaxingu]
MPIEFETETFFPFYERRIRSWDELVAYERRSCSDWIALVKSSLPAPSSALSPARPQKIKIRRSGMIAFGRALDQTPHTSTILLSLWRPDEDHRLNQLHFQYDGRTFYRRPIYKHLTKESSLQDNDHWFRLGGVATLYCSMPH